MGLTDREYAIHSKRHRFFSGKVVVSRSPHAKTRTPGKRNAGIWRHCFVPAIERLASDLVMFDDVDPEKIYVMGFSEGGYFSYRAVPSMSDRLAGVAPAAGGGIIHKDWTDNLVNTPIYAQSGEFDRAYKRNTNFREMVKLIAATKKKYPGRLHTRMIEYKGRPHSIPDITKQASAPPTLRSWVFARAAVEFRGRNGISSAGPPHSGVTPATASTTSPSKPTAWNGSDGVRRPRTACS